MEPTNPAAGKQPLLSSDDELDLDAILQEALDEVVVSPITDDPLPDPIPEGGGSGSGAPLNLNRILPTLQKGATYFIQPMKEAAEHMAEQAAIEEKQTLDLLNEDKSAFLANYMMLFSRHKASLVTHTARTRPRLRSRRDPPQPYKSHLF